MPRQNTATRLWRQIATDTGIPAHSFGNLWRANQRRRKPLTARDHQKPVRGKSLRHFDHLATGSSIAIGPRIASMADDFAGDNFSW